MDFVCNALIALITFLVLGSFFRQDGRWCPSRVRRAFRFFTVQSNALCGLSALLMCLAPEAEWVWLLKYVGTVAVTVTLLTVLCFLGPTMGYEHLLSGADLFMHLITPVLSLGSFCLLERRGLSFPQALLGLIPLGLYGLLYCYKVLAAPPGREWADFYGFNRGGRWPLSMAAMGLGTFLVCMGLMLIQNIP